MNRVQHNSQYSLFCLLSIYSAFIDCKTEHKCWLLCKIPHLFSWENITWNIFYLCAKTIDSIDSDTISNIRIIYRMCREGDKLADSCLKQTTLFDDIVSQSTSLSYFSFPNVLLSFGFLCLRNSLKFTVYFFLKHKTFAWGVRRVPKMSSKQLHSSVRQSRHKNATKRKPRASFGDQLRKNKPIRSVKTIPYN